MDRSVFDAARHAADIVQKPAHVLKIPERPVNRFRIHGKTDAQQRLVCLLQLQDRRLLLLYQFLEAELFFASFTRLAFKWFRIKCKSSFESSSFPPVMIEKV